MYIISDILKKFELKQILHNYVNKRIRCEILLSRPRYVFVGAVQLRAYQELQIRCGNFLWLTFWLQKPCQYHKRI